MPGMDERTERFSLYAAALCHKGRVRENNEDNLYFSQIVLDQDHEGLDVRSAHSQWPVPPYSGCLFAVFDGMGGHADGELASYVAASEARQSELKLRVFHGDPAEELRTFCLDANHAVCREARLQKSNTGTTASMLYFAGDTVWVCNVGDSPVYLFRDGQLTPIFEEHTERRLYERLYGGGAAGRKFALTQHIGIPPEEMLIEPYAAHFAVQPRDRYLICSDGLTDMVSEEAIRGVLDRGLTAEQTAVQLRDMALEGGGRDNITIIAVTVAE